MSKKLLVTMLAAIFLTNLCTAQTNNWGQPVNGVQLSISLSNNVLAVGSATTVQCHLKNTSTNLVSWLVVNTTLGFDVILTNSAGKVYFLTPQPDPNAEVWSVNFMFSRRVGAGDTFDGSVPIGIGEKIKPGIYQLEAKLPFYIVKKRQSYELLSNLLEVEVK